MIRGSSRTLAGFCAGLEFDVIPARLLSIV